MWTMRYVSTSSMKLSHFSLIELAILSATIVVQLPKGWRLGRLRLQRAARGRAADLFFTSPQGIGNSENELVRGKICAIVRAQKFPSEGTIAG